MPGIPIITGQSARVETKCTDCGEPLSFDVAPDRPPAVDSIVHFLLPAARWYDDIGFT